MFWYGSVTVPVRAVGHDGSHPHQYLVRTSRYLLPTLCAVVVTADILIFWIYSVVYRIELENGGKYGSTLFESGSAQ